MTSEAKKLFQNVLKLSIKERAEIVSKILQSLEKEEDPNEVKKAWEEEVSRRLEELDKGTARIVSWEEVREKMIENQNAREERG